MTEPEGELLGGGVVWGVGGMRGRGAGQLFATERFPWPDFPRLSSGGFCFS